MAMQTAANQGIVWVWRYPEEEYDEDCCGPTQISGFRKVRVWGAIRYNKLSKLVIFPEKEGEGKLDAKEYCDEIIDKELFNFWRDGMEELGDLLIMEDGAPYHKGVASRRRSEYGWVSWGPGIWPSNSPDLNPIEHVWHILRNNIRKRVPRVTTKEDLISALQEEWERLDVIKVNRLILSMPKRLHAVIQAKGRTTGY